MHTLVFAASKGGVGKTTLAAAIAVEATRTGNKVAIGDLDPQQSLARWHELRDDKKILLLPSNSSAEAMQKAAAKAGIDWLIIDTAPAIMNRIAPAVEVADLVVVPVRPSPLDLEAIEPVVELCDMFEASYVFVINANPTRSSLTSGTVAFLKDVGPLLETYIGNRNSYPGAMITGKTAAEIDKGDKAEDETRSLWKLIKAVVERETRGASKSAGRGAGAAKR